MTTALTACSSQSPTSSTPAPSPTFLSFVSQPGESVGRGQTRRIEPGSDVQFGADMWDGNNQLSLLILMPQVAGTLGRDTWNLQFAAPKGRQLVPGSYTNATRSRALLSSDPVLSLSGEKRSCPGGSTGQFEVLEAAYGPQPTGSQTSGTIDRFHATFTQTCDGSSASLTGEVWLVSVPRVCKITSGC